MSIIDAHAHCGIQQTAPAQSFEDYYRSTEGSSISKVIMFPPVMEIYDRSDPYFEDSPTWREKRKRANEYLLSIGTPDLRVIPFFFIWNDFAFEQLTSLHKGIKWHRHPQEPVYEYNHPRCSRAIEVIRSRNLPVIYEEELANTISFIQEIARGVRVVIPHLGMLNGGYNKIAKFGLWDKQWVYTDTSLADTADIADYIERFGYERIMFGSDFPFGQPVHELDKILQMPLSSKIKENILWHNACRLLS